MTSPSRQWSRQVTLLNCLMIALVCLVVAMVFKAVEILK